MDTYIDIKVGDWTSIAPYRSVCLQDLEVLKQRLSALCDRTVKFSNTFDRASEDDDWFFAHEDEYRNIQQRLDAIYTYCSEAMDAIDDAIHAYRTLDENIRYIFCEKPNEKGVA